MIVMRRIPLTNNAGYAIVDDEDFDYLSQWRWNISDGYARRCKYLKSIKLPNGKHRSINKLIHMHRVINKTPEGSDTDHINGNRLDNRRSNLRTVTRSHNCINRLGLKGVQVRNDRKKKPFRVLCSQNKKEIYISSFSTYDEAEQAYYTVQEQLNPGILQW